MRRSLILPTLLLAVAGCGDGEGTGSAFISATIDGTAFSAQAQESRIVYLDAPDGDGVWTSASRSAASNEEVLTLVVPIPLAPGGHALNGTHARLIYARCSHGTDGPCLEWAAVAGDPGTLWIDRVDSAYEMVEGRFSAVAYGLGDLAGTTTPILHGRFRIHTPGVFTQD